MISNEKLVEQLMTIDAIDHVEVEGDGHHYHLTIVSDHFLGKSKVARQQWVYSILKNEIMSGQLHAVNMNTWTKEEWEKKHG